MTIITTDTRRHYTLYIDDPEIPYDIGSAERAFAMEKLFDTAELINGFGRTYLSRVAGTSCFIGIDQDVCRLINRYERLINVYDEPEAYGHPHFEYDVLDECDSCLVMSILGEETDQ